MSLGYLYTVCNLWYFVVIKITNKIVMPKNEEIRVNINRVLLFFLFAVLTVSAHAAMIYRHAPFTVALTEDDSLIVNYDFAEKVGMQCRASSNKVWADFTYKGHQKSARLPLILESAHVPDAYAEELADASGQVRVFINDGRGNGRSHEINCGYLN